MPGMTLSNPLPQDRMGGEVQAAMVPGFYLSDGTKEDPGVWDVHSQLAAFFDPGEVLGPAKGLGVGLRYVGGADDAGFFEPMVRYRSYLDDDQRVALAAVGYFAYAEGSHRGASYEALRGGAELTVDVRLTPRNRWAELHVLGGASITGIGLEGSFCTNPDTGYGTDCDVDAGEVAGTHMDFAGAYPSAFVGISVDLFRGVPVLHGVRLGATMAAGTMPSVKDGERQKDRGWYSWGVNVTIGLGDW